MFESSTGADISLGFLFTGFEGSCEGLKSFEGYMGISLVSHCGCVEFFFRV